MKKRSGGAGGGTGGERGPSPRKARIEHAIREILGTLIRDEVRDRRVQAATLITVTKVEMNVDMAVANVYVSVVGDEATAEGVIEGLQKAAGFLRGPVGRELQMQHAPELRFNLDLGIDMSDKIAQILREDREKARAAGRELEDNKPKKPEPAPEPPESPEEP